MKKIALAAVVAAVAFTAAPLVVTPAKAQVDVQLGRDRDYRDRDYDRDHRGPHFSIGLGERRHCRTVITKIQRHGREIVSRERRCD